MKVKGTVKYVDLEGGFFVLETHDGKRYVLDGGDDGLQTDGAHVEVEGEVSEAMGISMTSDPVLAVSAYRVLDSAPSS